MESSDDNGDPRRPSTNRTDPDTPAAPRKDDVKSPIMRPIDHETLLERCRNNPSLVEKLLALFERQIGGQLASLRQELQQRNVHALTRITHTIRGTAENLSAEPIRASAAELETQILANDFESAATRLKTLEALVQECVGYLPTAIADARRSGKAGPDT